MKKILSIFLAIIMTFSCLSLTINAASDNVAKTEATYSVKAWFVNSLRVIGKNKNLLVTKMEANIKLNYDSDTQVPTITANPKLIAPYWFNFNNTVEDAICLIEIKHNNRNVCSQIIYTTNQADKIPFSYNVPEAGEYTITVTSDNLTTKKILTAKYPQTKCTITFDANLSSIGLSENDLTKVSGMPANCEIAKGGNIQKALSACPTLSGYTFIGWQDTSKTNYELVTENTTFNQNTTLKAVWQKNTNVASAKFIDGTILTWDELKEKQNGDKYNYDNRTVQYNGRLGDWAFNDCTDLSEITLPSDISEIGQWAFAGCTNLTKVTFSDNVKKVYRRAFEDCTKLKEINLNNSKVDFIEEVFKNCSGLNKVSINSLESWLQSTFYDAYSNPLIYAHRLYINDKPLTDLIIPEGVKEINNFAFINCDTLTSINVPKSLTRIGIESFPYTDTLTKINISDLKSWCAIDFGYDEWSEWDVPYTNPLHTAKNLYLNGKLITDLVIPEGTPCIKGAAFYGCTSITSVTIPDSVDYVGHGAFSDCVNLQTINFGKGITSIEPVAFRDCYSLTEIILPDSVTSVKDMAFFECYNVNNIKLSENITNIGDYAFIGCNFTGISIPDCLTTLGDYNFDGATGVISISKETLQRLSQKNPTAFEGFEGLYMGDFEIVNN